MNQLLERVATDVQRAGVDFTDQQSQMPETTRTLRAIAPSHGYMIRPLERTEFPLWGAFVQQSPQGTIFHSPLWLDAANMPYKLFGCFRGAELRGAFAAGLVGERAAGHPHWALTPYLGILFPGTSAKYVTMISLNKEIAGALATFLKEEFDSIHFRFPPEAFDLQPFIWEGYQTGVRYTYRLALHDMNGVLNNMDSARRRNIRGAEKNGISVESGAPFEQVVALSEQSFRRQGLNADFRDAAFQFGAALEEAGRCRSFIARNKNGAALGAVWIVWDEKRAYYLIGGYDESAESSTAVALAMWRAIQFTACELGLPEFDFEGSMIPAVERYFRKFGGTLTPTFTIAYQKPFSLLRRITNKAARMIGSGI